MASKTTTKCALITGFTGQDGSYLAEWLLGQGYRVHGIGRRGALGDPDHRLSRLKEIRGRLVLHAASLESYASIHRVVHEVQPDECYHLAAQMGAVDIGVQSGEFIVECITY